MGTRARQNGVDRTWDEAYFSSIYEYCPYAILLTEPDGGVLAANPAACKLFGMSEAEVCAAGRKGLVDQTDQRLALALKTREQSGKFEGRLRFVRGNGELFEGELASIVFFDHNHQKRTSMVIRDITEEYRLVQQLKDAEEIYHTVADNTYDWEVWINPDGQLLYCSPSCQRISGYTQDSFNSSPELLLQIIHPDDLDAFRAHSDIHQPGPPVEMEYRIVRADGKIRWIGHICQAVFSKQGEYLGRRCSNRDITDRKEFENSIRFSENQYRGLFENSIVGIVQTDLTGRLICVNQSYAELYGYTSPEEMLQKVPHIGNLLDASQVDYDKVLEILSRERTIPPTEVSITRKDGTHATILAAAMAIDDSNGNFLYYQVEQIDISHLKELEARMAATDRMAQTTIDSLADMICVSDSAGVIVYVNAAWREFFTKYFKFIPNYGIDQNVMELYKALLGEFRPAYLEFTEGYSSLVEGKVDDFEMELSIHPPDGKVYWFSGVVRKVLNSPDPRYIFTNRDISERKKILDERDRLIAQVRITNEKLRSLSRRLLEAHETERRSIARELHDEIGQELTAVKIGLLRAQQIIGTEGSATPPRGVGLNDAIRTIENTMSQVRRLSLELHPTVLDDLGLVPAIRWLLAHKIASSTYQTELMTDLEEVRFQPELEIACYRIVQEAITNSIKHASAKKLKVELWLKYGALHLSVSDDGSGFIPQNELSSPETIETFGIISMRERARLVGGRLEIQSTPGSGTVVTGYFPVGQTYQKLGGRRKKK